MTTIEKIALLIALQTTERQDKYALRACVPWDLIIELRNEFGPIYKEALRRKKEIEKGATT